MYTYDPHRYYPSSEELPDSDDKPVDNELQDLVPGLLKIILASVWHDRWDWFFGVDMGIYYDPDKPAIVPDGFLALGVDRVFHPDLRLSFPLWEEQQLPFLVLEVVSQKYRAEYSRKKQFYQDMGVVYYVIYNPHRRRKTHLEVYKLVNGAYIPILGNPVWIPEINLGIGFAEGTHLGIQREWLYWYDQQGNRYPTPEERADRAEQRLRSTEEKLARLEERLRSLGIDPEED